MRQMPKRVDANMRNTLTIVPPLYKDPKAWSGVRPGLRCDGRVFGCAIRRALRRCRNPLQRRKSATLSRHLSAEGKRVPSRVKIARKIEEIMPSSKGRPKMFLWSTDERA